jgi:hypothetical protein
MNPKTASVGFAAIGFALIIIFVVVAYGLR